MSNSASEIDFETFNEKVTKFVEFLVEATPRMPGPIHPNTKYYKLRKKKKLGNRSAKQSKSSNPHRRDKNAAKRHREMRDFELSQFEFYHQRRKAARKAMGEKRPAECPIPIGELRSHFEKSFSEPNGRTLPTYPQYPTNEDIEITLDQVNEAIKSISPDTSPGPDGVLLRTVRDLKIAACIKSIVEIMLITGWTPTVFAEGRMILIHKGGDLERPENFRPITIYPILRRIIERILDRLLRAQVSISCNQRGFVRGTPGCHVNAKLIDGCLQDAKSNKTDCTVAFLDISKAFDHIGHEHVRRSLQAYGVSKNLQRIITSLLTSNTVRIFAGGEQSEPLAIRRSVPQGGPLSPFLFNLAIDFIYADVCEPSFANSHGYKIVDGLDSISLTGFADDQAVTSSTTEGAIRIIEQVQANFEEIGLHINPAKSQAIKVTKGKLTAGNIELNDGASIKCIGEDETIKYLGHTFTDELTFDPTIIDELTEYMNNLLQSPLLLNDQKLAILNQYLLPKLFFALQAAPLNKVPKYYLEQLDKTIRATAKGAIGLPVHTPTSMIYAPRRLRGLGVVRAEKEFQFQHFAIALKLSRLDDEHLHAVYDCEAEMTSCRQTLGVDGATARELRGAWRASEYKAWCEMDYAGAGVRHYETHPKSNRFVSEKSGLSGNEWTAAIKLNFNHANLNGIPGQQKPGQSRFCRRCDRGEIETLGHVLGSCPFGLNRRNTRHHTLKHRLADLLRQKGFHTVDEAFCKDDTGTSRFIDIVAFDPKLNRAYIIDPTVRLETNSDLDNAVREEKRQIYEPCINDLKKRFESFGEREFEVLGLWMGAKGSISPSLIEFFERFGLDRRLLPELAEQTLSYSIKMIHHHIYATN